MLGLVGLPFDLLTEEQRAMRRRFYERETERRTAICVPWDPLIKWDQELNIKADTYQVRNLFPDVEPTPSADVGISILDPKRAVFSPTKQFVYVVKILPAGAKLMTAYGKREGTVMFDGPTLIPALHEKSHWREDSYEHAPWMSLTPFEMISLRGGIRLAKGHTVVAGLGLGHQLIEVSLKKSVKKITLVEQSQELIDWLMPRIKPFLGPAELTVTVGDAKEIVPTLTADVALIDIFRNYGGNSFSGCPHIKKVWCWGSCYTR